MDAIIVGSITEFGNETKKTGLGGAGGNWHGVGLGNVGHSNSKANVAITARIIDVDTGEILGVADGKGPVGTSQYFHARRRWQLERIWRRARRLRLQRLPEYHHWRSHQKGASMQLTINLDGRIPPRSAFAPSPLKGWSRTLKAARSILNVGGKAGIKVGDQFNVERVTREIKDPTTGAVLRRLATAVGIVKATDVDDLSAICEPVSGTGFKVGDKVKTVTQ